MRAPSDPPKALRADIPNREPSQTPTSEQARSGVTKVPPRPPGFTSPCFPGSQLLPTQTCLVSMGILLEANVNHDVCDPQDEAPG